MDRPSAARLNTTYRVLDKEKFEDIYYNEPILANIMLKKFKEFLTDDYFDDMERQVVLLQFLKTNYPLEITTDVLKFIDEECDLKEDYSRIILEWNLQSSDFIRSSILYKYDGEALSYSIDEKLEYDNAIDRLKELSNEQAEKLLRLVDLHLRGENDGKKGST